MLIIQHIWTRWTKLSRGANSPLQRPRLAEAYPLPEVPVGTDVFLHEIKALERENFAITQWAGPITRKEWKEGQWHQGVLLDWLQTGFDAEITLHKDTYRLQTKWPSFLPQPLFKVPLGETSRIDWNGRFRFSLFGSNRSSYYEQHCYWLAYAKDSDPRLFLDAQPRKHVDLRAHIY